MYKVENRNKINKIKDKKCEESNDYANAANWYRKAALQGHADSQYKLGFFYELGLGVPQSRKVAISWYEKAAKLGNPYAKAARDRLGY